MKNLFVIDSLMLLTQYVTVHFACNITFSKCSAKVSVNSLQPIVGNHVPIYWNRISQKVFIISPRIVFVIYNQKQLAIDRV